MLRNCQKQSVNCFAGHSVFVSVAKCVEVVEGRQYKESYSRLDPHSTRMDIFLLLFPLAASSVIIGSLELIRRFILAQPLGNRTVSYYWALLNKQEDASNVIFFLMSQHINN